LNTDAWLDLGGWRKKTRAQKIQLENVASHFGTMRLKKCYEDRARVEAA
jgi:hypothetical protein